MTIATVEEQVREGSQTANELLPARDLAEPGPRPMSLGDAMSKIKTEYSDALDLLGRI